MCRARAKQSPRSTWYFYRRGAQPKGLVLPFAHLQHLLDHLLTLAAKKPAALEMDVARNILKREYLTALEDPALAVWKLSAQLVHRFVLRSIVSRCFSLLLVATTWLLKKG